MKGSNPGGIRPLGTVKFVTNQNSGWSTKLENMLKKHYGIGMYEEKELCMETDRLIWRRMKAGTKLAGDCLVVYDHDPDPRLSRSAIYDGWYLPVSGLLKILEEQKE